MGFGFSIVLIAAGAILRFAVEPARSVAGTSVNWDVVGDVLMVVGGVGVLMSLIWMLTANRRSTTVVERTDRSM